MHRSRRQRGEGGISCYLTVVVVVVNLMEMIGGFFLNSFSKCPEDEHDTAAAMNTTIASLSLSQNEREQVDG